MRNSHHPQIVFVLLCFMGLLGIGGCTSTSAGFRLTATPAGQYLAGVTTRYVAADTTLDAPTKATNTANATALATATNNVTQTNVDTVEAAWAKISGLYRTYVAADPRHDATAKSYMTAAADKLDALIDHEQRRRLAASLPIISSILPGGSIPTAPASPKF